MKAIIIAVFFLANYCNAAHTECRCDLYAFRDGVKNSSFEALAFVIPDFQLPDAECNDAAIDKCKAVCIQRVGDLSNNLDLTKQPKAPLNTQVSFGQYVCDQLGWNVQNETLGLFAFMHCHVSNVDEHGVPINIDQTREVFTGLESQQTMSCVRGNFTAGQRTGVTTTTPPPTTTPTPVTTTTTTPVPESTTTTTTPVPESTTTTTTPVPETTTPEPETTTTTTTPVPETTTPPPETTTPPPETTTSPPETTTSPPETTTPPPL